MTLQNEKFEELIAQQLARELEPQRGRAAAAFQTQVAAEAAERAAEDRSRQVAGGSKNRDSWARREVSRRGLWLWMGVPSLIAACLAVVVTLPFTGTNSVPQTNTGTMIVKEAPRTPRVLNRGGSGGNGEPGANTLVTQQEIGTNQPSGVLQDYQPTPLK